MLMDRDGPCELADAPAPAELLQRSETADGEVDKCNECNQAVDAAAESGGGGGHNCVFSLKSVIQDLEERLASLECALVCQTAFNNHRENAILSQMNEDAAGNASNTSKVHFAGSNTEIVEVKLQRDENGSLGFNVAGGKTPYGGTDIFVSKTSDNVLLSSGDDRSCLRVNDIILETNGTSLRGMSHEDAVAIMRTASDPITMKLLRVVPSTGGGDGPVSYSDSATQTDLDPTFLPGCPIISSMPSMTDLESLQDLQEWQYIAADYLLQDPSAQDPFKTSSTDIAFGEFDIEYEEVKLTKGGSDETFGVSFYSPEAGGGEGCVFVGRVEPGSVAAVDGRLCVGDQLVQLNSKPIHSARQPAVNLIQAHSSNQIVLLVSRPAACSLDDEQDDTWHEYVNFSEVLGSAAAPGADGNPAPTTHAAGCDPNGANTHGYFHCNQTSPRSERTDANNNSRTAQRARKEPKEMSSSLEQLDKMQCSPAAAATCMSCAIHGGAGFSRETSPEKSHHKQPVCCATCGRTMTLKTIEKSKSFDERKRCKSMERKSLTVSRATADKSSKPRKQLKMNETKSSLPEKPPDPKQFEELIKQYQEQVTGPGCNPPIENVYNIPANAKKFRNFLKLIKLNEELESLQSKDTASAAAGTADSQWKVKIRADGTRYVTKTGAAGNGGGRVTSTGASKKQQVLKEREKAAEERCLMTTTDDESERKCGKFWSREERKQQYLEAQAKKRERAGQLLHQHRLLRQSHQHNVSTPNTAARPRTCSKHAVKSRDILNYCTVQQMLASGAENLFTVTTV